MLRYFHYGSDNEIEDRETAFTCPECGEKDDISYNTYDRHKEKEYSILCGKCR